jgi:hypothetical protein
VVNPFVGVFEYTTFLATGPRAQNNRTASRIARHRRTVAALKLINLEVVLLAGCRDRLSSIMAHRMAIHTNGAGTDSSNLSRTSEITIFANKMTRVIFVGVYKFGCQTVKLSAWTRRPFRILNFAFILWFIYQIYSGTGQHFFPARP